MIDLQWNNLDNLELTDEVISLYEKMKIDVSKGEKLLRNGDYENGWPLYKNQFEFNVPYKPTMGGRWKGETVDTVVLWQDQGFGDTIMYARYFPLIIEKIPRTFVLVKPDLYRLFEPSFPKIQKIIDKDFYKTNYVHSPLSLLPWLFKTTLETIPNKIPYLTTSVLKSNHKIGWCWEVARNTEKHPFVQERSISFEFIEPLMKKFGGISLQLEDLKVKDFSETAAIINGLDLIITVDTVIAHLAGALGKPAWIMLPYEADWRWGLGNKTPWYPTTELFRQSKKGDWKTILEDISFELEKLR